MDFPHETKSVCSLTQAAQASALRTPCPGLVAASQAFAAEDRPCKPHDWFWISLGDSDTRLEYLNPALLLSHIKLLWLEVTQSDHMWVTSVTPFIPIDGSGQRPGRSQNVEGSQKPVWPPAGSVPVQPVSYYCQLATNDPCSPVTDPEGGVRRCLVQENLNTGLQRWSICVFLSYS